MTGTTAYVLVQFRHIVSKVWSQPHSHLQFYRPRRLEQHRKRSKTVHGWWFSWISTTREGTSAIFDWRTVWVQDAWQHITWRIIELIGLHCKYMFSRNCSWNKIRLYLNNFYVSQLTFFRPPSPQRHSEKWRLNFIFIPTQKARWRIWQTHLHTQPGLLTPWTVQHLSLSVISLCYAHECSVLWPDHELGLGSKNGTFVRVT